VPGRLENPGLMRNSDGSPRLYSPMSDLREIELKLAVPGDSLMRLTGSSLLKRATRAKPRRANVVSVYYDTEDHSLHRKGVSLRVRRIGRRLVQTVKHESRASAALFARDEWEKDIRRGQPDLEAVGDTALAPLLTKKVRRGLKPVFETRVRRTILDIRKGDSEIELSIDKGKIKAGRKSSALCEVELELKRGAPAGLFRLAKALAAEVPLQLAVKSKADRGYALLNGKKPEAVKAVPVVFAADADVQTAFRIIARACLHQLVANQSVTLAGDPAGLHQMRVALRRLRAAISLFSGVLANPQTEAVKSECKRIASQLGPARELEVFLTRVMNPVSDGGLAGEGMAGIFRELRKRRKQADEQARAALESRQFQSFVLDTAAWIEAGDWISASDDLVRALRERPIAAAAADELHRRWKTILKKGKGLHELNPRRRHKLRIQTKKLRYAAEFFSSAFPGKKARRRFDDFAERLTRLQDALGDLNDIVVHAELSAQLVDSNDDDRERRSNGRVNKAFAAGRLLGHEEARIAPALSEAERAYDAFAKAKPFWL
jgi:triphosphatase